jgi:hypothetical protein
MNQYPCACPDINQIDAGAIICNRCNGLKVSPVVGEMKEEQRKRYEEYIETLQK